MNIALTSGAAHQWSAKRSFAAANEYVRTRDPRRQPIVWFARTLRLVVKIARRYRRNGCDLRDLVQEGNLGLVFAVQRFDPQRGVKLASYAVWWIRAYLLKYTLESWRLVKAGTTQAQRRLFFSLQKERNKLEIQGVRASPKELAATLGVEESDVVTMTERFAGGEVSLDTAAHPGEAGTIGDSLSAAPAVQPDVQVEMTEFRETVQQKLTAFGDTLRGRDRDIFRRRLLSEEPATLGSLATRFGVTSERTRQLEHRLKGRIRDYLQHELGDAVEPVRAAA